MKKSVFIALAFVLLASIAAAEEVSITRSIPQITSPNQEFKVSLHIEVTGADPSGLIISETIPEGWQIVGAQSSCIVNNETRLIKCVLYGDLGTPLAYTLKSPQSKGAPEAVILGEWKTLTASGQVKGGLLKIAEPEQETERPAQSAQSSANQQPQTQNQGTQNQATQDNPMVLYIGVAATALLLLAVIFRMTKKKK